MLLVGLGVQGGRLTDNWESAKEAISIFALFSAGPHFDLP